MTGLWEAREARHLHVVDDSRALSDIDLERAVLGAGLLFSEQILPALSEEGVTGAAFHWPWHATIWTAMQALDQAGEPVEVASVAHHLRDAGATAEQVAGLEMLTLAPELGSVRFYAQRLVRLAEWRSVRVVGHELVAAAESLDDGRRERAENMLAARLVPDHGMLTPEALGDLLFEHLASDAPPIGFPMPFRSFERNIPGFSLRPGETTLIGAWTGMGKSLVVDAILTHLGRLGHRVHLYINEGGSKVRGLRILSAESGVPLQRLMAGITMSDRERASATAVLNRGLAFGITPCGGWGAAQIVRDLRHRKWDVAAVDHMHLIEHRDERDLAAISLQLTTAAQVTGTHIIAAVQLNEERAKQAKLPPPVLRDIRGSGMVKNDAHNVLFVHREDEVSDKGVTSTGTEAGIYLAKCRNGGLGGIDLQFDGPRVRFLERDRSAA